MKILVFGATGTIGRHLTEQALEEGHEVTAFVRDPAKLSIQNPNLAVAQGNVLDPESVERAVPGHDAVIIALGAGARGAVRADGTVNVVRSMTKHKIARLVCLSTLGVGESWKNLNFLWKYVMFGFLLRKAYADHVAQEETVKTSTLEWTIVRPGAYTDGPLTKQYRHGFSSQATDLALKVSRRDVADFMLQQLQDDQYVHKAPGLSY